jgi:hypothetical protein
MCITYNTTFNYSGWDLDTLYILACGIHGIKMVEEAAEVDFV